MKYYIKRDLNEYGPYTLADLQRYVAQGNISLNDMARSEAMPDWTPVSQIIGNIPVPVPSPAMPGAYAGATVYSGQSAYGTAPAMATTPGPPDFHWAFVLVLGFVTCGIFTYVWLFIEAGFVRKIAPQSKGILFMILAVAGIYGGQFMNIFGSAARNTNPMLPLIALLLILGGAVCYFVAVFSMRSDLEQYYNSAENIGLSLSGVMTFFFAVYYFQHHFSRISRWKKTGVLEPQ